MSRKKCFTAIFTFVIFSVACVVFFLWADRSAPPAVSARNNTKRAKPTPLSIQGFSFSRHDSEKRVFRMSAGSIEIAPRKFMIFNIRPLNEAILEDVRIDFFRYPDDEEAVGPPSDASLTGALKSLDTVDLGLVTRGLVKDLEIRFHEREDLIHWLRADKVRIDLRKRELLMAGVRICDQKENREILARKAVWRESEERVHIPGKFLIVTPNGRQEGRGGVFRLRLN